MLLALGMIAFAMMLGSGAMRLRGIFVKFGSFIVLVFSHCKPLQFGSSQSAENPAVSDLFLEALALRNVLH
jgi:hypothetical protein